MAPGSCREGVYLRAGKRQDWSPLQELPPAMTDGVAGALPPPPTRDESGAKEYGAAINRQTSGWHLQPKPKNLWSSDSSTGDGEKALSRHGSSRGGWNQHAWFHKYGFVFLFFFTNKWLNFFGVQLSMCNQGCWWQTAIGHMGKLCTYIKFTYLYPQLKLHKNMFCTFINTNKALGRKGEVQDCKRKTYILTFVWAAFFAFLQQMETQSSQS